MPIEELVISLSCTSRRPLDAGAAKLTLNKGTLHLRPGAYGHFENVLALRGQLNDGIELQLMGKRPLLHMRNRQRRGGQRGLERSVIFGFRTVTAAPLSARSDRGRCLVI